MVEEEFVLGVLLARRRSQLRKQRHQMRPRPSESPLLLAALAVIGLGGLAALLFCFVALSLLGRFIGALPPPEDLNAHSLFQTTPVLAGDGQSLLYEVTDPEGGRRTLISLDEMPRYLIEATISTEDAGFFTNPGVEPRAIVRAAFDDITRRQIVSGASTITQQVVRNILFSPDERTDQSALRKVKEAVIAYQVSQTYSKDQILQIYLNAIPYGNRSYGIQAAAEGYFGKSVESLDLAECALLAGLPQAPSYYDPYQRLDEVKARQAYVLQRMVIEGYITSAQAQEAYEEPLHFVDRRHATVAPHFVSYIVGILDQKLGTDRLYHDGDIATTTLDLSLQQTAETALSRRASELAASGATNASIVVLDPRNGHILAMVGSLNYDDPNIEGEVNMAFAPRSSGGILSPLTYAMGLNDGETLISPLSQSGSTTIGDQSSDSITLREALAEGLNGPATYLLRRIGSAPFFDLAQAMGVPNLDQRAVYSGSKVLASVRVSPLEVAQIYAALASNGQDHAPVALERIAGPNGTVLFQAADQAPVAVDPGIAYLVTSALADRTLWPANEREALPGATPIALHTAESDGALDSWFVSYTPNAVVVVWLGNTIGGKLSGGAPTLAIGSEVMQAVNKRYPAGDFPRPDDVVALSLCRTAACAERDSYLALKGTESTVEKAHAAQIAETPRTIVNSQTPLVDRDGSSATVAVSPSPTVTTRPAAGTQGPVKVPEVSGLSPEDARQRLTAAGLSVAPLIRYQSGALPGEPLVAVGQVVGTAPGAGRPEPAGSSIVLIIRRD